VSSTARIRTRRRAPALNTWLRRCREPLLRVAVLTGAIILILVVQGSLFLGLH
jgi:hypothetical protein